MIDLGKNRDGAHMWIDAEGFLRSNKDFVLEHMTVTFDSDGKTVLAIDPSGGPYLEKGGDANGHKITGFKNVKGRGWRVVVADEFEIN